MQNMLPDDVLNNPLSVNALRILDNFIEKTRLKADWLAKITLVTPAALSQYRHRKRPLPLVWAALFDDAVDQPIFLRWLADVEGYEITKRR